MSSSGPLAGAWPAAGALAPDFDLPANGGGRVSLASFRGRAVILYFYPKDDTSGCTQEARDFDALGGDFTAAGAVVIGLSPDSARSHDRFKAKHGLTLTLAADEDGATLRAYGVWIEKSMYGRKYMGVERATLLIDAHGRVARAWRPVKVPGHAAEVLEATRALRA